MNVSNIIDREDRGLILDVMKVKYVVEQYIKEKKDVDVKIKFSIFPSDYMEEVQMLDQAYQYAKGYFVEKFKKD